MSHISRLIYNFPKSNGSLCLPYHYEMIADEKRMELTKKHSIYMHPLPADRDKEVTPGVIDGPHSVVYQEAENRIHVQKALLSLIM